MYVYGLLMVLTFQLSELGREKPETFPEGAWAYMGLGIILVTVGLILLRQFLNRAGNTQID